jgi:hypothetical protein
MTTGKSDSVMIDDCGIADIFSVRCATGVTGGMFVAASSGT